MPKSPRASAITRTKSAFGSNQRFSAAKRAAMVNRLNPTAFFLQNVIAATCCLHCQTSPIPGTISSILTKQSLMTKWAWNKIATPPKCKIRARKENYMTSSDSALSTISSLLRIIAGIIISVSYNILLLPTVRPFQLFWRTFRDLQGRVSGEIPCNQDRTR